MRNIKLCLLIVGTVLTGCRDHTITSLPMSPTIKPGEKITVDYSAFSFGDPKRWDVVLFRPVETPEPVWVMRVVGLPGERISITATGVIVNGSVLKQPPHLSRVRFLPQASSQTNANTVSYPYQVPKDAYFLLGDNSPISNDSRYMGGIPKEKILGRVINK